MELNALYYRLKSLTVYRGLLKEPILDTAVQLVDALRMSRDEEALEGWAQLDFLLQEAGAETLAVWLWDALRYYDGAWARLMAGEGPSPEAGNALATLEDAARRDVGALSALAVLNNLPLCRGLGRTIPMSVLEELPFWADDEGILFDDLNAWYKAHGCGPFARCRAFLWDGDELLPVPRPDCPAQEDLVGYRLQRDQVEANTRALLAGKRVNNVLLFGDSGTGKSATVKSLLSLPDTEDLRLIEIEKNSVETMPRLIRTLGCRRQKFILFLDDLAFDQDDRTYSVLKTILEGGLEPMPDNVVLYATTNRRSLVRQTFSDRAGDEVERGETIQEKTALADRFGLRIPYLGLSKSEYLELVEKLAGQKGLELAGAELAQRAMKWDVRHPGRSPRTARQFVDSL